MLALQPAYLGQGWLRAKLALVALLTVYHLACARVIRGLAADRNTRTGEWFRVMNEGPTLVLVLVCLLVVFKEAIAFSTVGTRGTRGRGGGGRPEGGRAYRRGIAGSYAASITRGVVRSVIAASPSTTMLALHMASAGGTID